ncbi:MAG: 1-acyl-sn-glycerol-3-phosphate acyltransferase [Cyanobacteria bacterium P01_D01_bin.73]
MPEAFVSQVQPALEFIPPNFSGPVRWVVNRALPWWLKHQLNIAEIDTENAGTLVQLYQQFQAKQIRLVIAFRHPQTTDPFCLAHLFWNAVPQAARDRNITFAGPPWMHSHFMYDRGIPLWAGSWVTWLLSHLGGTPIMRGKVDRPGLKSARDLLLDGQFPLTVAPEGATNNHSEIVSPLEPGVAQLAFWCDSDLRKGDRSEQVIVVPVGLQYGYVEPPWTAIDQLLEELEADLNITHSPDLAASVAETRYRRLYRLGESMLDLMENFYRDFYQRSLPEVTETDPNQKFAQRLQNLLDATLTVAEEYLNVKPRGTVGDRCRRLEQAGWDRIYRADLPDMSPVERGLADWVAREASSRMGHMRLVERFTASRQIARRWVFHARICRSPL